MTARLCWTCNTEHDINAACPASNTMRTMRAAGSPGNTIADRLFAGLDKELENLAQRWLPILTNMADAINDEPQFGPIFTATYETDCESCPEPILPGEDARADGQGGWIHADTTCERIARS